MTPLQALCLLSYLYQVRHIQSDTSYDSDLVSGSNTFGYELIDKLHSEDTSANIWISPFCITSCFSLVYPGAAGDTQSQIADVMGYPTCASNQQCTDINQQYFSLQTSIENTYNGTRRHWEYGSIIGIANKIYISDTITAKQSYIDALSHGDESFIEQDFNFLADNASTIINDWVDDNTKGLIPEIIKEGTDMRLWKLVALNAIYLNGSFETPFPTSQTSQQSFYTDITRNTAMADCHMMHEIEYYYYYDDANYQYVKVELSDYNAGLFIIFALPKSTDTELITDNDHIPGIVDKMSRKYVALALPKISVAIEYELEDILPTMGITDVFDETADFSGITEDVSLVIDKVIHKTMIDMDESGLVAAAVTVVKMIQLSGPIEQPTPLLFKADHPFQMFIVDSEHDNLVLFQGYIANPEIPDNYDGDVPIYDESQDPVWQDDSGRYRFDAVYIVSCVYVVWNAFV